VKLRFDPARQICEAAVADGTVPGLVLLVAAEGQTVFHEAFGSRQLLPRRLPTFADTVYDLASLTKALVTSVLVMGEVGAGRLALDTPVAAWLPEFAGPGRDAVTVRQLLCHASGLPAHRPYWRRAADSAAGRWEICQLAAREPLEYEPGARAVYSDLGFILLGWLLERLTGTRLDLLMQSRLAGPLGLGTTTFVSLADPDAPARLLAERSVAATQLCPERRRLVLGEVDDLNAAAMGGIAGHAGLFGNAAEIGRIAGALTAAWRGEARDPPLIEREVVRTFWSHSGVPGSTWRLGWDGPAQAGSQAGERLPRGAVGHLGFTGCSLWIDPARAVWIVLLSNRVHPAPPTDDRFRLFRPALHDAVAEALGYDG